MFEFTILTAVVAGIVSGFKKAGLSSRYAPLLSIVIGLALSYLANSEVLTLSELIMTGLVIGLTASGAYSGVKATVKG
jgi:hypothetical protein